MRVAVVFIAALLIVGCFFQSCDKKSCENVICGVNSTCTDGNCYCLAGYEGDNCDELSYLKYIGTYNVSENCTTTFSGFVNQFYSTSISVGSNIDLLTINNFSNRGLPIDVNIIDATYLLIQEQDRGALQVSGGEGFYQFGNQIRFEYNYTVSNNFHSCTAIFTKF